MTAPRGQEVERKIVKKSHNFAQKPIDRIAAIPHNVNIKGDEMRRYKLLGIEESEWTCEFCHKMHINRCFTVRDLDSGDVMRFGSSCIRKALGIGTAQLKSMVAEKYNKIVDEYEPKIANLRRDMYMNCRFDDASEKELADMISEYNRLLRLCRI